MSLESRTTKDEEIVFYWNRGRDGKVDGVNVRDMSGSKLIHLKEFCGQLRSGWENYLSNRCPNITLASKDYAAGHCSGITAWFLSRGYLPGGFDVERIELEKDRADVLSWLELRLRQEQRPELEYLERVINNIVVHSLTQPS